MLVTLISDIQSDKLRKNILFSFLKNKFHLLKSLDAITILRIR